MSGKKVIVYDVGTTSLKTSIFELSKEEGIKFIDGDVRHYELFFLDNGGAEQNPSDWWNAMGEANRRLLAENEIKKEEIEAISFCSQMQTVVMTGKDGNALRPAMSCMDCRADEIFKSIMSTGFTIEGLNIKKLIKYKKITGLISASAKDPAWKYLWVKENQPEIFAKTWKWFDAKEFLIYNMTGNAYATQDVASGAFIYDINEKTWSRELCEMLGIDMKHLPGICKSTDKVGEIKKDAAKELGLAEGTDVYAGGSDVSLCQIGAGCVDLHDVLVYSGTSGWVTTTIGKMTLDIKNLIGSLRGGDPDTYLYIAEAETAGKCMEWAKERLAITGMSYDDMMYYIKDTPAGSNGIMFTPWMRGNRCPFDDADAKGIFFNVGIENHGSDMIKAVVEGVCMHMRWMLEATERKAKTRHNLRFAGGSALSPLIGQTLADVTGRTVETVENPIQVGARGAAGLLSVGLGMTENINAIKKLIHVQAVYEPDPINHEVYNTIFPVFKTLHKNNKRAHKVLNRKEIRK